MNLISITMDINRCLSPDSHVLGVERDHKIDKLVLITKKLLGDTDLYGADVSLHLKAENGYTYNSPYTEKLAENDIVYFVFPVTREMTCVSGRVWLEFYFENSAVPFAFTSRSAELMVAKPLTDTSEVESDYPGMLSDVLSSVEAFSKRLDETDAIILAFDEEIGVLFDNQAKSSSDIDKIKALLGYDDEEILGLEADFENNVFTRLAGAKDLSAGADFDSFPMYQRRRCNVSDNGEIVAYYGDENYRDDGTNGQVMVYQPAFYYRVVPTKLEKIDGNLGYHVRKASYYISAKPKPYFKLHPAFYDENGKPVEYILYGAYEGNVSGEKLCSVAGVKPTANETRLSFEGYAKARGAGWHIETIEAISLNQLLMAIEYASFNAQESIGMGVVAIKDDGANNCASITGSTAFLGNDTGSAVSTVNEKGGVETVYTEDGCVSVSYRGVENLWGNVYKHISNVNVWGDGTMLGGQPYVASDFSFSVNKHDGNYSPAGFTMPNSNMEYVNAFGYGNEKFDWLFAPSEAVGTSALPIGDYRLGQFDVSSHYGVAFGGRYDTSFGAGCFMWRVCTITSGRRDIACRLIYLPVAK